MKKTVLVSALVALAVSLWAGNFHGPRQADAAKTAFARVQETRTLRCAYAPLSPFIKVDPNTGAVSGLFRDALDEIGRRLNLKIDWVEEVGYGQIAAGFAAHRYDAFCGVLWATPARGGAMTFSDPLYYNRVSPCVRANTATYDSSTTPLNDPSKTLIGYDGDVSLQVARAVFPRAKTLALPETTPFGEAMQNIVSGKADALATCDRIVVDDLNKTNGNALKIAAPGKPITYVQVALALPAGDFSLKNMMDLAIFDMRADGTLRRIMTKYLGVARMNDTILIPGPAPERN